MRPRADGPFLELAQGVVEWGMAHRVNTVTVAMDWRLMVIAMQLRFFVRPLGFPKRIGRDEVVALRMSFNREISPRSAKRLGVMIRCFHAYRCRRRLSRARVKTG
jgi:N-acyl-L-homoserine lactone synthetase